MASSDLSDTSPDTPLLPFTGLAAGQIGILVDDIDSRMAVWGAILDRDDWLLYTYGPNNLKNAAYRGRPGSYSMRLAMIGSAPQIELIEPADGPNIYADWIADRGYGLHHIGFYVPSITDAVRQARKAGFEPIQQAGGYGANGDGGFAYFDTTSQIGLITELIEVPSVRRPNEYRKTQDR
jgi:methylmalonyl-CoA/ethylmalonyl-CoA epimerase